jgi:hypothetical protein
MIYLDCYCIHLILAFVPLPQKDLIVGIVLLKVDSVISYLQKAVADDEGQRSTQPPDPLPPVVVLAGYSGGKAVRVFLIIQLPEPGILFIYISQI